MTQRGLGPASQRGGETARLEDQAGVADGIDAAVDAVQPPGPHPRRDRAVAHSQLGELRSGHEPPLPSGQPASSTSRGLVFCSVRGVIQPTLRA